jgi:hypothetical protein
MRAKLGVAAAVVVAALAVLTGCAPTIALQAAHDDTNPKCALVVALLPQTVSNLDRRLTNAQGTGAWGPNGDVYLRCGVPIPDPTATLPCFTVQGIDWLYDARPHQVYVFTTYGRNPAVAITVDAKNVTADGNQALTDLAEAVAPITATHHCKAVSALKNGVPVTVTPDPSGPTATPTPTTTP